MKNDLYFKVILTIIAVALCVLAIQNTQLVNTAQAGTASGMMNYGLVPLNDDGSVDVNIKSSDTYMKVDLRKIEGQLLDSKRVKFSTIKLPVYVTNTVSTYNSNSYKKK